MSALVTGAAGEIGRRLLQRLGNEGMGTDIAWYDRHLDVTDAAAVRYWFDTVRPDTVYHLAAAKDAPSGELEPAFTTAVNLGGTVNIVEAAQTVGAKVILASTCKAADPETAYGASKLVAERVVLNAGGVVTRFYNVPETAGNVFRLWEAIPEDRPIPFTDCWRYFTPLDAAAGLLKLGAGYPSGRYAIHPGLPRHMADVARELYPDRQLIEIPRRRGDRRKEPLHAACEDMQVFKTYMTGYYDSSDVCTITSPYDQA